LLLAVRQVGRKLRLVDFEQDHEGAVPWPVRRRDGAPAGASLRARDDLEHVAHLDVDVRPELGLHPPLGDLASSVIGDEPPRRADVDPGHADGRVRRLDVAERLTGLGRTPDHGAATESAGPHAYLLPTAYSS